MADWKIDLQREFELAENARARGNEGQARVCARRAAGIALREALRRRGITLRNSSVYELLGDFIKLEDTPPDLRQIAGYLTMRVTEEFTLPLEVDLVKEAQIFCERLLPGEITF